MAKLTFTKAGFQSSYERALYMVLFHVENLLRQLYDGKKLIQGTQFLMTDIIFFK